PADTTPSSAAAAAGFTNAPDRAYTALLKANGHTVTRIVSSGNPNTNLLNAFDLVIVSRSVLSGDYELASETAAWNGVTAPMMILSGYALRGNRLGFFTGSTIPDTAGPVRLAVNNPAHPIFSGIALDAANTMANNYGDLTTFNNRTNRGISVVTDSVAEGGTVLATVATSEDPAAGGTVIAEWKSGATLSNPTANVLGGDRLVFLTGSREYDGLTSEGSGLFDLSADGAKMFLNAVNYMAGVEGGPGPAPTLSVTRNGAGLSISFTGKLQSATSISGGWADEPGAISPLTVTPNQPAKFYRARQ
ncbi:MAG TPA: hypothetical protein VK633_14695, partial [Verrucomicrobiae bacterium]|nr:hypothetical protein [Verrucomicrobiae bacterium]